MTITLERIEATRRTGLVEVAAGVYAYVQPDGGWCVNNSGVIVGDGTTVLFDSVATQSRAERLRAAVDSVAPPGPSQTVLVNSHHHSDHTFGNSQFPAAVTVAHDLARQEMIEAGQGLRTLWPDVVWGETPIVLPAITFHDQVTLHAGRIRVELIHVGPAHTTNDVVAWLPEQRVLFTGDVIMSGVTPFCLMGSVAGTLVALERLRELDPVVIVSGHGPIGGPELFQTTEDYFRWINTLALDGLAAGRTPLEVAATADLGAFATLLDPERLVPNLHRAWAELNGTPLGAPIDLMAAMQDMSTHHGGRPVSHA